MRVNEIKTFFKSNLLIFFLLLSSQSNSFAVMPSRYEINESLSSIKGSIHYSIIGEYQCSFQKYTGVLNFDPDLLEHSSVYLEIDADSINSNFKKFDKIATSPQILNAEKYPKIIFQSETIERSGMGNEYVVIGDLTIHGVTKKASFPFNVEYIDSGSDTAIRANGEWTINRKDFNIYWHPFLDKGGLVLGNHLKVKWNVTGQESQADAKTRMSP